MKQIKYYVPYIIILILLIILMAKGCNKPKPINSEPIKTSIKKLEFKKVVEQVKANKSDSVRTKYVIKWRTKLHDTTIIKPCEELILICDTIIKTDSTEISQLKHVNLLNDSIILNQKIIIYNDSIDKVCLTKWGKKQRRQKILTLIGIGIIGGLSIVR